MKKLLLILLFIPFLNNAQTPCILVDTVYCDSVSAFNYTYQRTRGFWFQPLSTFHIVAVKAADGNPQGVNATHQSIEIIEFDTLPLTSSSSFNPHTVLFSTINVPHAWVSCNVQIDSGGYYAVVGAKNDSVPWLMYNSYTGGTTKLLLNGDSTVIHRAGIQFSLGLGSPANGQYFDDGLSYIGRVHIMTGINNNPHVQINQVVQTLNVSVFGGSSPYTFYWNTGEITQTISPQSNGNYWAVVTDANGCVSDTAYFNVTFTDLLEFTNRIEKKLDRIINILGEPGKPKGNTPLFYIYNDGTIEKKITIE